jgi:hypothetical protein
VGGSVRKRNVLIPYFLLMGLTLGMALNSTCVDAGLGWLNVSPGEIVGQGSLLNEGTYEVIVNGSGQRFNVFICPGESFNRSMNNESFGFFQEWSKLNVTYADINFTVPTGSYAILVQNLERGDIYLELTQGAVVGPTFPWEILATVLITAFVTVCLTYLVLKRRSSK